MIDDIEYLKDMIYVLEKKLGEATSLNIKYEVQLLRANRALEKMEKDNGRKEGN